MSGMDDGRFREETLAAQDEEDRYEDQGLEDLYRWAAANVDYLTDVCLGPVTQGILDRWENGSDEQPWNDAGEVTGDDSSEQETGEAAA